MPQVECQSGRTYLLELNKVVLEEMSPKVTDSLTPEIMAKMKTFAQKVPKEELDTMSEWEMLSRMEDLTADELTILKERLADQEVGPNTIKVCIRNVGGDEFYFKTIDNPWTAAHPGDGYKDWSEFIDRDETFIDDLPELIIPIKSKLTSYFGGIADKGELMPSSKNGKPQKKAETLEVQAAE